MRSFGFLAMMLALAVVVILVHWPALNARARIMDDEQYLTGNQLVQNPGWASARQFLTEVSHPSTVAGYYQPLAMISLMLDDALGGRPDHLLPFHRTSLLLHAANTALVALLMYYLFGKPWPAAAAALLFGLHPMTVETIPWIGERKTLLAAFFVLLSLLAYLRYCGLRSANCELEKTEINPQSAIRNSQSLRWYILCIVCYLLALLSKPTSTPLPLLLLLMDVWPLRRFNRRAVLEKAPFFALGAVFAVITVISQRSSGRITPPGEQGVARILLTLCHNIIFYLEKMVWPASLSPHYPVPQPLSLDEPMVLAGVIGTVLLLGVLLYSLRWTPALLIGWLFFFIAIFPTMGVIGFTNVIASDKFVYLPSIGLLIVLAWSLSRLPTKSLILVVAIAGAETVATRLQLNYWQDTESLCRRMIAVAPNAAMPYFGLAKHYAEKQRFNEAVAAYQQALQRDPAYVEALNNLANLLIARGRTEEAIPLYEQAVEKNPNDWLLYKNIAMALARLGRHESAAVYFVQALQLLKRDPLTPPLAKGGLGGVDAEMNRSLAISLVRLGRLDEAIHHYNLALNVQPDDAETRHNLAVAFMRKNDLESAKPQLAEALRLKPDFADAHNSMGTLLARQGRVEEALGHFERAMQIRPAFAIAWKNAGASLASLGRTEEAVTHYRRAVQLDPKDLEARHALDAVEHAASRPAGR